MSVKLSVLLMEREPGHWAAQALEYDIGAQAGNLTDLLYELERTLNSYVAVCLANEVQPFADLQPAPREYWDRWRAATISVAAEEEPFRPAQPTGRPKVTRTLKLAAAAA